MQRIKTYLESVAELAGLIATHADAADRTGRLADVVVASIHDHGLLRVLLPADDDGGGLRLGDSFPIVEAMARIDGAAGWNLAVGINSLAIVAANAPEPVRSEVLGAEGALVAGGINPRGLRALVADGAVVLDGRVPFASGSPHATWLAALALLDDGPPIVALVPPAEAEPIDSWDVAGMRGTGSHDWLLRDVVVPDGRWFRATTIGSPEHDVMARLPLLSALGPSLAFVALGVARHAVDLLVEIAAHTAAATDERPLCERPDVQLAVATATGMIEAGRAHLTATWRELETLLLAGGAPAPSEIARLRLASVTATRLAADATDDVQRVAGSSALYECRGIARCWRDVHAVTQHAMVSHRHLERVGRILLGMPAGPGPI